MGLAGFFARAWPTLLFMPVSYEDVARYIDIAQFVLRALGLVVPACVGVLSLVVSLWACVGLLGLALLVYSPM
jgi:hypothetical protein